MKDFLSRLGTWIADPFTEALITGALAVTLCEAVRAADRRAMRAHQRVTRLERSLGLRAVPCG